MSVKYYGEIENTTYPHLPYTVEYQGTNPWGACFTVICSNIPLGCFVVFENKIYSYDGTILQNMVFRSACLSLALRHLDRKGN